MKPADELAALLGKDAVGERRRGTVPGPDWSPMAFVAARSGRSGEPGCVVRPRSTEQVAQLLEWAHHKRVPVVPRGGGSGVCGAISHATAVVVDLRDLNEVLAFDDRSRVVVAQAGVRGDELDRFLARNGYTLGHEPQSIGLSTVGGWIATRACGQQSAAYGGIETMLAGLEAVLPGGAVARSRAAPRRATGPDVASLMLGSEGVLGIVTEATLRVHPAPIEPENRCVHFVDTEHGIDGCRRIAQSALTPTLVRLYDEDDAALLGRGLPGPPPGPLLLLSFTGRDAQRRADEAVALTGGSAGDGAIVDHWWRHRNDAVDDFHRIMSGEGPLGPHGLVDTMEVSATWAALPGLYSAMKSALSAESHLAACHLSHVYADGACLYFTLASACTSDDDARETHARWWDRGMRVCLDSGGTISHHHGIGRVKARWLPEQLGGWWEVLAAVKRAVDPHNIMNPGVLGL